MFVLLKKRDYNYVLVLYYYLFKDLKQRSAQE